MANPTTNFNWQMPTSSDLVTDLPADFETFGQAVDTSLADLKGGTTGQILSKASGTDMDFTWTTPNPGDITGVTAGTGITGGGTSGDVTVSFDQANFGGGQYAAGKNKIINGDFGIWQRGTSTTGIGGYGVNICADRFIVSSIGGSTAATQQAFTAGTAPVAGYEAQYFLRNTPGSGVTYWDIAQRIEDVRTFAGQTVTFSFWAKSSATVVVTPSIIQQFGSGGSSQVTTNAASNVTLTTSWVRYSATIAVPSISGKTIGSGSNVGAYLLYASGTLPSTTIDTWGWQVEAGSTATPFQTATGTIQGELAACQRYYQRPQLTSAYTIYSCGSARSTTQIDWALALPVSMRVAPTAIDYSNVQGSLPGFAGYALSALVINHANTTYVGLLGTSTGLTQYRPYFLENNGTSGYVGLSAEL